MAGTTITNDGEYMMAVISLTLHLAESPHKTEIRDLILAITKYVGEVAEQDGYNRAKAEFGLRGMRSDS